MEQITRRASVEALKKQAYEANRWSSFNPERAGEVLLNCCEQELSEFLSKIPEEFHEEYEKRFLELFRHWLAAQSRCASPAVTGPAKFPTAKNRKYLEWERSAREKLNTWVERVVKRLNRQHRLTGWEEIERLQEKIDRLTELQELMKKANAVIRKKSLADVEKVEELENLGLTEKQALELMDGTGCWWGKGFAPFQLTNNNAKIKSTQERLDRLTNMVNTEDRTEEYEWGSLEYCYSEERLRIHFNEIPDEKLRSELKGSAFKWSRFNQAWQRQLTDNAIYAGQTHSQHKVTAMEQITKHCAHCGQDKPVTEFYRDKHTRDGLQSWCKECSNSRSGNRRAKVADIDWEQRRYEIARTILPYCAETTRIILMGGHSIGDQFKGKSIPEAVSEQATQYADALIDVLKRQEP